MRRSHGSSTAVPAAGAALLVVAGTCASAWGDADPPDGIPVVQARAVDAIAPAYRPPADDGPALRPNHPPIELIPPIPMPEPMVGPVRPVSDSVFVHDAATGETIEIPLPAASGAPGGSGGGSLGADGGGGAEVGDPLGGFSNLVLVQNPWDAPWRMNCKLVMRFTDEDGYPQWFQGSAAMIDAETVVTAGHCVYARYNGADPPIFDWPDEMYVYPGWDGLANTGQAPPSTVRHYGFGVGTFYAAGGSWFNDGDLDGDCGLIRISRTVGVLTGWFGWTWGQDCGWIQSRTYYNASYPAEYCGQPGLHDGRDMYFWSGTIDSCPGNQLRVDTGSGCFDAAWGGMSGSGMYWNDSGYRRIHAIASTADHTTYYDSCKLWEGFATYMNDTFIPASRGAAFDLQALDVNAEPDYVDNGSPLTLANFVATNPTNGSASGTWTLRVYMSTNDEISADDTLISTQTFDYSFAPMSSVRVNLVLPTIPADTPIGQYWIGVILDPATDGDPSNNDTDGWDAPRIEVYELCPAPPLSDTTIVPSTEWQSMWPANIEPDGCFVVRMYLYPGYDYDFSACADDDVGGSTVLGDSDFRMYDASGTELWHIDGHIDCDYNASTLGSAYEGWSPPEAGYYYLELFEFFSDPMTFQVAYKYTDAEHCYAPPSFDVDLSPASTWQTTGVMSIEAPGACRVHRVYLSNLLDYDFSTCVNDGVGGWADPGNADFLMLNSAGNVMWTINGDPPCAFDATTIGSAFEGWSPPFDGYYYLAVREYDDEPMTYRLAYRIRPGAPPPNDDCVDVPPVHLSPGLPVVFTGVNVGATIDSNLAWPEAWHAITTAECVDLELSYCGTLPPHASVYVVLKDTCPALGPNVMATSWETESCDYGNWTVTWDDLPAGTYWYPVLTRTGSEGPYRIEATAVSCAACPGDFDGSGDVDFQDLLVLLAEWGPCVECSADIDGNDWVDFQDLLILLAAWGAC